MIVENVSTMPAPCDASTPVTFIKNKIAMNNAGRIFILRMFNTYFMIDFYVPFFNFFKQNA